jgi:hypothetical protein
LTYLRLTVDPFGVPLQVQPGYARSTWPVDLPDDIRASLLDWNGRFASIISREDLYEPKELARLKLELNREGLRLARRIEDALGGGFIVQFLEE